LASNKWNLDFHILEMVASGRYERMRYVEKTALQ